MEGLRMNDHDLIGLIAKTWIDNGGDSIGFEWTRVKILARIKEMERDKGMEQWM
jgi:hypothetical protein